MAVKLIADLETVSAITSTDQLIIRDPEESTFSKTKKATVADVASFIASLIVTDGLLDSDLTAIAGLSSSGFIARTGDGTAAVRTITGTANEIDVVNGAGGGNPTMSLPAAITLTDKTVTGGTFVNPTLSGVSGLTLLDSGLIVQDNGDNTKQFRFEASGITAGQTRVYTVPDADATLAGIATTQTLTNKTINLASNTLTGTTAEFNTALSDGNFATLAGSETLTNKIITAPDINGGTADALTSLGIRSTGSGAFDLQIINTENLASNRALTITLNDAARTVNLGGNLTTAAAFITSGANSLTLTTTGATNVTLPTTGTLASLSDHLGSFAATTSAQLAGIISDETGSGALVFATSPGFTTAANPVSNDGAALGTTALGWSDLHLASGALINVANGDAVITHSAGIFTVSTGDLRVTTAGTNSASVVTVGGTQALTGKTLTSPVIDTSPTAAGATWTDLGAVTTVDINGGTIDGATIGGSSAGAGTFTTMTATTGVITSIELGHASDSTITRVSAGVLAIEGSNILTAATGQPLDSDLTAIAALSTTAAGISVLTIADPGADRVIAWDDSAGAMAAIAVADIATEGAPAAGDFVLLYGAEGDLRKVNWSSLPGAGGGLSNVSDDTDPALGGNLDANTFSILFDDNTGILDQNGNEVLLFRTVASAVNYLDLFDAATGGNPKFAANGSDSDIGINFEPKGAGKFNFLATTSGPAELRLFEDADNGSNYVGIIAPATLGSDITITLPGTTGTAALTSDFVGKQCIPVPASAMYTRTTNGAASGTAETTNKNMFKTFDFDASTAEFVQFCIPMPDSWNEGTITFAPVWSHPSTVTNFGVVFTLAAVAVSNDDAGDVAFGTPQSSTDTGGTTDDIYIGPESSAITVDGSPAAGDFVMFQLSRLVSDGGDTMAVDARLHGIKLFITTAAGHD